EDVAAGGSENGAERRGEHLADDERRTEVQRRGPQVSRLEPLAAVKQPECNRGGSTDEHCRIHPKVHLALPPPSTNRLELLSAVGLRIRSGLPARGPGYAVV